MASLNPVSRVNYGAVQPSVHKSEQTKLTRKGFFVKPPSGKKIERKIDEVAIYGCIVALKIANPIIQKYLSSSCNSFNESGPYILSEYRKLLFATATSFEAKEDDNDS